MGELVIFWRVLEQYTFAGSSNAAFINEMSNYYLVE